MQHKKLRAAAKNKSPLPYLYALQAQMIAKAPCVQNTGKLMMKNAMTNPHLQISERRLRPANRNFSQMNLCEKSRRKQKTRRAQSTAGLGLVV